MTIYLESIPGAPPPPFSFQRHIELQYTPSKGNLCAMDTIISHGYLRDSYSLKSVVSKDTS